MGNKFKPLGSFPIDQYALQPVQPEEAQERQPEPINMEAQPDSFQASTTNPFLSLNPKDWTINAPSKAINQYPTL